MRTAGIVLAAGASQRMGRPKALLKDETGLPLALRQSAVLREAGCDPVAIVIGARAPIIRRHLPADLLIENPRWRKGRTTSLQAALRAFPDVAGWLFLPVDAAGIRSATLRIVLNAAERAPEIPWRPVFQGRKGHVLWIPASIARAVLALPAQTRMDAWIQPRAHTVAVDDPAVLTNLNTPADWRAFLAASRQSKDSPVEPAL